MSVRASVAVFAIITIYWNPLSNQRHTYLTCVTGFGILHLCLFIRAFCLPIFFLRFLRVCVCVIGRKCVCLLSFHGLKQMDRVIQIVLLCRAVFKLLSLMTRYGVALGLSIFQYSFKQYPIFRLSSLYFKLLTTNARTSAPFKCTCSFFTVFPIHFYFLFLFHQFMLDVLL